MIFKEVWERCRGHEGYLSKKESFLVEQKEWDKERRKTGVAVTVDQYTGQVKNEHADEISSQEKQYSKVLRRSGRSQA